MESKQEAWIFNSCNVGRDMGQGGGGVRNANANLDTCFVRCCMPRPRMQHEAGAGAADSQPNWACATYQTSTKPKEELCRVMCM